MLCCKLSKCSVQGSADSRHFVTGSSSDDAARGSSCCLEATLDLALDAGVAGVAGVVVGVVVVVVTVVAHAVEVVAVERTEAAAVDPAPRGA